MANMTIPTSRDIYLELNGKKLAVVQGYSAKALRTSREVEAFGESEPVATVGGQTRYTLELSRLYATDEAIAARNGTTVRALCALNPQIANPNRIYPGERVRLS